MFLYNIDDLQSIVKENLARRRPSWSRPRRSSRRRSRASPPGCSRARSSRPSSRCGSASRPSARRSCAGWSRSWRGLPPGGARRVDEVTRLIVEKLLLTPTEQLKAVRDDARRRLRGRAEPAVRACAAKEDTTTTRPRSRRAERARSSAPLTTPRVLRIGTRGSALALWQAHTVAARLRAARRAIRDRRHHDDRRSAAACARVGRRRRKRLFVKEIEDALLRGDLDLAVHSAKDMPVVLPEGWASRRACREKIHATRLVLPGPRDPLRLVRRARRARRGAIIGTSSVRRVAQLAPLLGGAAFAPIRGNVDTRLRKLDAGEYDALVLAAAGLRRLGSATASRPRFRRRSAFRRRVRASSPSRSAMDDEAGPGRAARDSRRGGRRALAAERALVAALGGGCQLPLGAHRRANARSLELLAIVASLDGTRVRARSMSGRVGDPDDLGRRLAAALAAGARARDPRRGPIGASRTMPIAYRSSAALVERRDRRTVCQCSNHEHSVCLHRRRRTWRSVAHHRARPALPPGGRRRRPRPPRPRAAAAAGAARRRAHRRRARRAASRSTRTPSASCSPRRRAKARRSCG